MSCAVPLSDQVEAYQRDGYVIFRGAIAEPEIAAFETEFNAALASRLPLDVFIARDRIRSLPEVPPEAIKHSRFVDVECHLESVRRLILHTCVRDFFRALGIEQITCLQTLTYKYSSQQRAHSDLFLVDPPWVGGYERSSLAASWIALEDADDRNGALVIYPGSHLLEKRTLESFSGNYQEYAAYLEQLCESNGIQPRSFNARRGDILFWHGDFVHAGGKILEPDASRFSLVSHYAYVPPEKPAATTERNKQRIETGFFYGAPGTNSE